MNILLCKAVSKNQKKWVYGYPVKQQSGDVFIYKSDGEKELVFSDTICYCLNETDKNNQELYIGDIVNDFGGGVHVVDKEHPQYHPSLYSPPTKVEGDTTRLGTIVLEDGTIRIETAAIGYAYNISNGAPLNEMEFAGNQYDHLIEQ